MRRGDETEVKQIVWKQVLRIQQACREQDGFENLADLFHPSTVLALPRFARFVEGRDACLELYRDSCSQMRFRRMEADQERIDLFGPIAVASFRYLCDWEFQGKRIRDIGHEVLAFVRSEDRWQVAWRSIIPEERTGELAPIEPAQEQDSRPAEPADERGRCLKLMEDAEVCMLTSIDADGFPQTRAMYNLRNPNRFPSAAQVHRQSGNPFQLYLTTGTSSPQMLRLRANPKVSIYFCDAPSLFGFMLGGEIRVVEDRDLKRRIWENGWTMYYPDGPDGDEYGVLSLTPQVIRGWSAGGGFELLQKREDEE